MVEVDESTADLFAMTDRIAEACEGQPIPVVIGALCASLVCCISMSTDSGKDYHRLVTLALQKITAVAAAEALRRTEPGGNA